MKDDGGDESLTETQLHSDAETARIIKEFEESTEKTEKKEVAISVIMTMPKVQKKDVKDLAILKKPFLG